MSKLSVILKLPLRLFIFATLIGSFYAAYAELVTWGVPILNTGIIVLYIVGLLLERKPKDAVPEDIGTRESATAILTEEPKEEELEDGRSTTNTT